MIAGLGLDITELDRIASSWERHGERFARRILSESERAGMPAGNPVPYLAARFAAKEAAVKALGTGFSQGIGFQEIEVVSDDLGKPVMNFSGPALERARALGVSRALVSLTHGRDVAAAVVVLETD